MLGRLLMPGSRISETRETTKGSAELKFRIQFPPAESRANFQLPQLFDPSGHSQPFVPLAVDGSAIKHLLPLKLGPRTIPGPVHSRQAAFKRPSCWSAVTPSSRPTSSAILPFSTRSTVVPVNRILRPDAAGRAEGGPGVMHDHSKPTAFLH